MKLVYKYHSVSNISNSLIANMYKVFDCYYDGISLSKFKEDLSTKNKIIVLYKNNVVIGFSTVKFLTRKINRVNYKIVFSGDTIVEQEYWGENPLKKAFIKLLLLEKIKSPLIPVYWFLISKGYKTYLVLTRNALSYYPRHNVATPNKIKKIIDSVGKELYPNNYDVNDGLIKFNNIHDRLKSDIAPITNEMMVKNPDIKYFVDKNPTWKNGTELACLGKFDYKVIIYNIYRSFKKFKRKSI